VGKNREKVKHFVHTKTEGRRSQKHEWPTSFSPAKAGVRRDSPEHGKTVDVVHRGDCLIIDTATKGKET